MINNKVLKKDPYITSNKNIFDIICQRVTAKENGATVFVPHVCNNIDLFDAGFAAQVAQEYPSVKMDYHLLGKTFLSANLGYSQIIKVFEEPQYRHKLFFVNMIAQNGVFNPKMNPRPLNYEALMKCMINVRHCIKTSGFDRVEIHAPRFGSLRSGGDFRFISDLIDDIWHNISVIIYNHNETKDRIKYEKI